MQSAAALREERGSGTVLAVAIIGGLVALATVMVPVLALLGTSQSVQNAADAAALAAADAASGVVIGVPCERAAQAAGLNDAVLTSCALDELTATVTVERGVMAFMLRSESRAGPPRNSE